MTDQKSGPAADDEADVLLPSDRQRLLTKSSPKKQSQLRLIPPMPSASGKMSDQAYCRMLVEEGFFQGVEMVGGIDAGPLHLLRVLRSWDDHSRSPRVLIGFAETATAIWVCPSRRVWSWQPEFRLFYERGHRDTAIAWAIRLARKIRTAAELEHERRDKLREARLREREARP